MKPRQIDSAPSNTPIMEQPETSFELINKYGTYNIQPTADTLNTFPAISQGLSNRHAKEIEKHRNEWIKNQLNHFDKTSAEIDNYK